MSSGTVGRQANEAVVGAALPSPRTHRSRGTADLVLVTDVLPQADPVAAGVLGTTLVDEPAEAALLALVSREQGCWIGRAALAHHDNAYRRHRLDLDPAAVSGYDAGQSRATIWPLYHDLARPARYDPRWRAAYRSVNGAFARAAAADAAPGATVWVHDYKLQLVPAFLRRLRPDVRIGFHLRTPFPPVDLFEHMPMHRDILGGLLGADLLGFQTAGAAENFLRLTHDLTASPAKVGVYPTGPDTSAITRLAQRPDVIRRAAALRRSLGDPATVILSINGADQAQGVERRLLSLDAALRGGQLDRGTVAIVQVILGPVTTADQPTVDGAARAAARVNGQHAQVGRPCVHYTVNRPDLAERVALYLAADVLLATPLREGATIPAIEYVAAARQRSALVLSEFSGTAAVLTDAYLVNPYDDERVVGRIAEAISASDNERVARMKRMREEVRAYDNHTWADRFLSALGEQRPDHGRPRPPRRTPGGRRWLSIHSGRNRDRADP